jgi:hypothetical protein
MPFLAQWLWCFQEPSGLESFCFRFDDLSVFSFLDSLTSVLLKLMLDHFFQLVQAIANVLAKF